MRRDLPRDVCLKADYKDMLTNAAVQVVCTQTVAQHGHRKSHTDAPDAHKHAHAHTYNPTEKLPCVGLQI